MTTKRKIEIFSAGCAVCDEAISQIRDASCTSCEIVVLSMKQPEVARRASALGIKSIPAVLIDGVLADCCSGRGVDLDVLKAAGLGKA